MTNYATVADLLKKRPDLTSAQQVSAQEDLDEGSELLRQLIPGLDDSIAGGTVSAILARKVLRDAVLRVLRNPSGVSSQTVGPESASWSGQASRAELGFLPSELALLMPSSDNVSVNGFVIGSARLSRPSLCETTYVSEEDLARGCW